MKTFSFNSNVNLFAKCLFVLVYSWLSDNLTYECIQQGFLCHQLTWTAFFVFVLIFLFSIEALIRRVDRSRIAR